MKKSFRGIAPLLIMIILLLLIIAMVADTNKNTAVAKLPEEFRKVREAHNEE